MKETELMTLNAADQRWLRRYCGKIERGGLYIMVVVLLILSIARDILKVRSSVPAPVAITEEAQGK